jgi:hypothetical protein
VGPPINSVTHQAAGDLSGFSVMFGIIYLAFVQLGYLLFGTQVADYSTFIESVYTLFRMIMGDFNFTALVTSSPILGPIFFICYIFFVFFVLLVSAISSFFHCTSSYY